VRAVRPLAASELMAAFAARPAVKCSKVSAVWQGNKPSHAAVLAWQAEALGFPSGRTGLPNPAFQRTAFGGR
jgi:hypothetical protein